LLIQNNCSSSYKINPADRISIPAGTKQVSFSVTYNGSVIPYMCSVQFKISSFTNINYGLETSTLYLAGSPSIDKTNTLPPMILSISKTLINSQNVGTAILTADPNSSLKPIIYSLISKKINSNSINLEVSTS
jgi:hypothetical protein